MTTESANVLELPEFEPLKEWFLSDREIAIGTTLPVELWPLPEPRTDEEKKASSIRCPAVMGYTNVGEYVDAEGNCYCARRCDGGGMWWSRCNV